MSLTLNGNGNFIYIEHFMLKGNSKCFTLGKENTTVQFRIKKKKILKDTTKSNFDYKNYNTQEYLQIEVFSCPPEAESKFCMF